MNTISHLTILDTILIHLVESYGFRFTEVYRVPDPMNVLYFEHYNNSGKFDYKIAVSYNKSDRQYRIGMLLFEFDRLQDLKDHLAIHENP